MCRTTKVDKLRTDEGGRILKEIFQSEIFEKQFMNTQLCQLWKYKSSVPWKMADLLLWEQWKLLNVGERTGSPGVSVISNSMHKFFYGFPKSSETSYSRSASWTCLTNPKIVNPSDVLCHVKCWISVVIICQFQTYVKVECSSFWVCKT